MKQWTCYGLIGLLSAALAIVIFRFVVLGKTVETEDERTAVLLKESERDFVLAEMRDMLDGVQRITVAIAAEDMDRVAAAADDLGMHVAGHAPPGLIGKLPLSFKSLGFGVHRDFDQLAMDARSLGDPGHALKQLGKTLNRCVACHAAYRIDTAPRGAAEQDTRR